MMTENVARITSQQEQTSLQSIITDLQLKRLTGPFADPQTPATSVYASDLLSCVMTGAKPGGLWITLQSHSNIVAVAALLELAAVIITEGAEPDPQVIESARQREVCLLQTPLKNYEVAGRLWALGIPAS